MYIYTYTYIHIHIFVYVYIYLHIYKCICTYIRIHQCTHTDSRTHMHTYIYARERYTGYFLDPFTLQTSCTLPRHLDSHKQKSLPKLMTITRCVIQTLQTPLNPPFSQLTHRERPTHTYTLLAQLPHTTNMQHTPKLTPFRAEPW